MGSGRALLRPQGILSSDGGDFFTIKETIKTLRRFVADQRNEVCWSF
jgi:hypothetical protein